MKTKIKQTILFILGFATAMALLFWPRKGQDLGLEKPKEPDLFDAIFRFNLAHTSAKDIEQLAELGYLYMGNQQYDIHASQWSFQVEDVSLSYIKRHHQALLDCGYEPDVLITEKFGGASTMLTSRV